MQNNNLKFKIFSALRCYFSLFTFRFKFNKGFTLLEMIVSVGVFSIAILIATSSFLNLQSAEKKAQTILNLQNNLRFAAEVMAKEMRTGTSFHCGFSVGTDPLDCQSGDASVTFKSAQGQTVIYRKVGSTIQKSSDGGLVFQPITASNIEIEDLRFYVVGSMSNDNIQPRVSITVKAFAQSGTKKSELVLQTSLSQRKPAP